MNSCEAVTIAFLFGGGFLIIGLAWPTIVYALRQEIKWLEKLAGFFFWVALAAISVALSMLADQFFPNALHAIGLLAFLVCASAALVRMLEFFSALTFDRRRKES